MKVKSSVILGSFVIFFGKEADNSIFLCKFAENINIFDFELTEEEMKEFSIKE